MIKNVEYWIEKRKVKLEVSGDFCRGEELILLEHDDNLIAKTSWAEKGYAVVPFLNQSDHAQLLEGLRAEFLEKMKSCGMDFPEGISPSEYHQYASQKQHLCMVGKYRNFIDSDQLPISLKKITDRISEVLDIPVTNRSAERGEFYFVRFVRPGKQDFNPPHRDNYINRIRNAINIYVPLWGSNELSSLPMLPGSHLFKESEIERSTNEGATVNNVKFTVPCVANTNHGMRFTCPNPQPNEMLIFSPYLIHGGAANFNSNLTRVSLEMRFWREK